MRVTNAKHTGRNADYSKRTAKRAILLAMLVASATTAGGQEPSGGLNHSRSSNTNLTPLIVRQVAGLSFASKVGGVRTNPFVRGEETGENPNASGSLATDAASEPRLQTVQDSVGSTPVAAPSVRRTTTASSGAPVRINRQFVRGSQTAVDAQPLLRTGNGLNAPAGSVEAFDRFDQSATDLIAAPSVRTPQTVNLIAGQNRKSAVVPATAEAGPLISPPVQLAVAPDLADRTSSVTEDISNADPSVGVPATDAHEDLQKIQAEPPVLFSLTDDSAVAEKRSEEASAGAVTLPEPEIASEERDQTEAVTSSDSFGEPENGEPVGGQPQAVAEHSTGEKMQVELDDDNPDGDARAPAVDLTPVKLAPVLNFAKQTPSPVEAESVRQPVVRFNPQVNDSDDESLVQRNPVNVNQDGDQQETVALPTFVKPANPIVGQIPMIESVPTSIRGVKRQAIAVATPPIRIERSDAGGNAIQPAVGAVTHDPSAALVRGGPPETIAKGIEDATVLPDASDDLMQAPPALSTTVTKEMVAATGPVSSQLDNPAARLDESVELDPVATSHDAKSVIQGVIGQGPPSTAVSTVETVSAVETVAEATLPELKTVSPESALLQLSMAQVRSLTIGGKLRRISIVDKGVCQAFASGANQIKLIGTGLGRTELTVWADVKPGEPTRMQTFVIDVSDSVDAIGDKVTEHTALLNDSIDQAFPRASVVVSRRGGELIVTGRCDSEATAKQIIRMVRKSCLVPVQDNLKVR